MNRRRRTRFRLKNLYILLSVIVIFVGSEVFASALPQGMVIGDDKGVSVSSTGEYFVDIPEARAGETYTKVITLRSTLKQEPFSMGLRVYPKNKSDDLGFNDYVLMTLTLDGKEIYKGKVLGDGKVNWSEQPLSLGTFKYGSEKVLEASFYMDSEKDYSNLKEFQFGWEFIATRDGKTVDPVSPETEKKSLFKLPQTGEEWRELIYQILAGLLLLLIALLLWKRKKQEEKESEEKGESEG